jgi:hypothetical protein
MKCETAQQNMIFAGYGELHDEQIDGLEEHLASCENCRAELESLRSLQESLALNPMVEPSPNLLAQSRMRLDDELDLMPAHGFLTHLRGLFFGSLANIRSSPALTVLLVGVGFFAGYFTLGYQNRHAPKQLVVTRLTNEANSTIANVSGIVQTPDSEIVQVSYNRIVPETIQGSLDQPEIRRLLMKGSMDATTNGVRESSVSLLAHECRVGHRCVAGPVGPDGEDGEGIRTSLLVSLRYDKNPVDRMAALQGLEPYIAQDKRVRNAVLEVLMHDPDLKVRAAGLHLLPPVESDSSVRQVLRRLSTEDDNPYIRTASFQALQGSGDFQ